jgi:pimeloyl-ACP methyl ester carboxylesterase
MWDDPRRRNAAKERENNLKMPTLRPITFTNHNQNLIGFLHMPDGPGPHPAVVYCHGFTGQCLEPGFIFVKLARRMADAGIASFRFDFRGSGNSDGEFRDMTISGEISDAITAIDVVKELPGIDANRIGLLGFSMGGAVASETTAKCPGIKTLCLWSPVSQTVRQNWNRAEQMVGDTLDLGPLVLGRGFVDDLPNHDPVAATIRWGGPLKVIHGSADITVTEESARAYLNRPQRSEFVLVEGAEHGWFTEPIQDRLFTETTSWFRETL